jgi:5-bromo-4-chloroindolyl phosphate hydrolysis protein
MPNAEDIIVADGETLRNALTDVIRESMIEHVPDAIEEAQKGKWLHRDDVKKRYGLTDRQLQYLRDKNKVTYSQRGRRIWYLRESVEEYFEKGRVDAKNSK